MKRSLRTLGLAAAALMPALAFAHPGHAEHAGVTQGLAQGLAHPFSGFDHLLALAAVGMLAGRLGGRAMWTLLAAWLCLLGVGAATGLAGVDLPTVRPLLIVSIVVCALLAIVVPKAPQGVLMGGIVALATFFAFFHGFAHGEFAHVSSAGATFIVGVAAASAIILALAAAVTKTWWPATTSAATR